jgi:hypothetical protein
MDGQQMHNQILLGLPRNECGLYSSPIGVCSTANSPRAPEAARPITHGYFMNSGLASFLNVMEDGKSVEVGLAGKRVSSDSLGRRFEYSPSRVVAQVAGSAFRIRASDFAQALRAVLN